MYKMFFVWFAMMAIGLYALTFVPGKDCVPCGVPGHSVECECGCDCNCCSECECGEECPCRTTARPCGPNCKCVAK